MIDLKALIDNLPIAIFLVDKNRHVLMSNQVAKRIHFVDQSESKVQRFGDIIGCQNADENGAGCGFSSLCHLCQVKAEIDRSFTAQKSITQFETNISTRSMGVRCLKMIVSCARVNGLRKSRREMCIVTVEDITKLKKKERLEVANETIGAICHEMNQPLQAIMGNVELLTKFQLEDGAILKIEKIFSEMKRIKSINSKLMNLTHYISKPYRNTNILDVEKSTS